VELAEQTLEPLRKDEEFVLYRGQHRSQKDAGPPSFSFAGACLSTPCARDLGPGTEQGCRAQVPFARCTGIKLGAELPRLRPVRS
jgi:hypothetical protein